MFLAFLTFEIWERDHFPVILRNIVTKFAVNRCKYKYWIAFWQQLWSYNCLKKNGKFSWTALLNKILWPQILNPKNVLFLFYPWKLVPTKIKQSTVYHVLANAYGFLPIKNWIELKLSQQTRARLQYKPYCSILQAMPTHFCVACEA